MNIMFELGRTLKLSTLAVASALVVSCTGAGSSMGPSKGNMIPDDAVFAVKVEADKLLNKALGEENSQLRDMWNMSKLAVSGQISGYGELGELARKIIKDPTVLGVDLDSPVVLSGTVESVNIDEDPSGSVYAVALLEDRAAFISVADAVMKYAKDEMGYSATREDINKSYTYYMLGSEDECYMDLAVAAKGAVLRFRYDEYGYGDMKQSMLDLFVNGGPANADGLSDFYSPKNDIAVWSDVDASVQTILPVLRYEDPQLYALVKSNLQMIKGMTAVSDLLLEDGKTVMNFKAFGSDQMKEYATRYMSPASDKYVSLMPATSALVLNMSVRNLPDLVEQLRSSYPEVDEIYDELQYEMGLTDQVLAGLSGTITVAIDGKELTDDYVPFVACIECNGVVWRFVENYLREVAESQGDNTYVIDDEVYVFYEDGHITVVDSLTLLTAPMAGTHSFADTALGKQIRNGGLAINIDQIPNDVVREVTRDIFGSSMSKRQVVEICNSAVFVPSSDFMSATATLSMMDKKHNLLESILLKAVPSF